MKESLSSSKAARPSNFLPVFLSFFLLLIMLPTTSKAQVYLDGAWEYSAYTNEGDFDFDPVQNNFRFTVGCIIYQKEDGFFHTGADMTNFSRVFKRQLDGDEYRYLFRGLSLNLFAGVEPIENLKVEAGFTMASYGTRFEKNGEQERLGDGFRSFDYGLTGRTFYYIIPSLAIGLSSTRWFNPMLSYTPIGDFGEFLPEQRWIETITYNLFIRYQVGNSMKR
ncbi:MAG: hypothetical protein WBG42_02505 [Cryomorphaceae bacterium]